jgi:hypothetical protein
MRRTRDEAEHSPPFVEDLMAQAQPHLDQLQDVTLLSIGTITPSQRKALHGLWYVFRRLASRGSASCVGITKAVLLLTNGRIGPAFDSTVRRQLGIDHVVDPEEWIMTLVEISLDIRAFELKYGVSFIEAMPSEFQHLQVGRLCDMVLGPRE